MPTTARFFGKFKQLGVSLIIATSFMALIPTAQAAALKPFEASVAGPAGWAKAVTKKPGDYAQFIVTYHNLTAKTQTQVYIEAKPPVGSATDAKSITLYNPANPNGTKHLTAASDGTGLKLGTLKPGATAFVQYGITLPAASQLKCGDNTLVNTLSATVPGTGQQYSQAIPITVHRECQPTVVKTPVYRCDMFQPVAGNAGRVTIANFSYTAQSGASFVGVSIDWGDGAVIARQTDLHSAGHTYAHNGSYDIVASVFFSVTGQGTRAVTCHKVLAISTVVTKTPPVSQTQPPTVTATATKPTVTTTNPPAALTTTPVATAATASAVKPAAARPAATPATSLVNTGAGKGTAVAAVIAVVAGALGYQFWLRRLPRL